MLLGKLFALLLAAIYVYACAMNENSMMMMITRYY